MWTVAGRPDRDLNQLGLGLGNSYYVALYSSLVTQGGQTLYHTVYTVKGRFVDEYRSITCSRITLPYPSDRQSLEHPAMSQDRQPEGNPCRLQRTMRVNWSPGRAVID